MSRADVWSWQSALSACARHSETRLSGHRAPRLALRHDVPGIGPFCMMSLFQNGTTTPRIRSVDVSVCPTLLQDARHALIRCAVGTKFNKQLLSQPIRLNVDQSRAYARRPTQQACLTERVSDAAEVLAAFASSAAAALSSRRFCFACCILLYSLPRCPSG